MHYPSPPCFDAPFQISHGGVSFDSTPATFEAVRTAMDQSHGAVFTNVITPRLLDSLLALARSAQFESVVTADFGDRAVDGRDRTAIPFCVALARPQLLSWIQQVGGCQPIATVEGLLARMLPGDILSWHRDAFHGVRRLAVVINLSEQPFEGGRFELRARDTLQPIFAYDHKATGSMMVFRLGPNLQHRVTPVTAGGPRIVFAGWLRAPIGKDEPRRLPNASGLAMFS